MTTPRDPLLGALAELRAPMTRDQRSGILRRLELVDRYVEVATPVGQAFVVFSDRGISYLELAGTSDGFVAAFEERPAARPLAPAARPPAGLAAALATGRGNDVAVDMRAMTPFQRDVLTAARTIRPGEVRSYQWIAARIGRPRAVRAVGTALATNPVPILVPCHRVVRSDGTVGEYVFGAPRKQLLLEHEGANLDEIARLARGGYRYVGSATTGVFCHPSCRHARRIAPRHRRLLTDAEHAEAEGLRPCRSCRPTG